MEEIEKAKNEALEKLRAIQTLEDVKEHDQEIVDTMVGFFTGGVEILRAWLQDMASLEPEQKQMEMARMQNSNFLADEDIENELERISSIPGADEYLDPFLGQLEERMTPVMEETQEIMQKLVDEMGAAMMGSMQEAFGGMEEEEEEEVYIEPGSSFKAEGVQFYGLTCLNEIQDHGGWEYYKERIPELFEDRVKTDLEQLNIFRSFIIEDGVPLDNFRDEIDKIEKMKTMTVEGLNRELERIATIPKAADEALKMKDDCHALIDPKVKEMDALITELRGL